MDISTGIHIFQSRFRLPEGHVRLSRSRNDTPGFHRRTFSAAVMLRLFGIIAFLSFACIANSTVQEALSDKQRTADLNQLAAMFAKNYAPHEWKRDVVGFDLMRMTAMAPAHQPP